MNAFNRTAQSNSIAQQINAIVTAAFSVAVIATIGVMTTAQYLTSLAI